MQRDNALHPKTDFRGQIGEGRTNRPRAGGKEDRVKAPVRSIGQTKGDSGMAIFYLGYGNAFVKYHLIWKTCGNLLNKAMDVSMVCAVAGPNGGRPSAAQNSGKRCV